MDILTRPIGAAKINITKDLPGEIEGYLDWTSLCEDFGSDIVIKYTINDEVHIPNEVKRTKKNFIFTVHFFNSRLAPVKFICQDLMQKQWQTIFFWQFVST